MINSAGPSCRVRQLLKTVLVSDGTRGTVENPSPGALPQAPGLSHEGHPVDQEVNGSLVDGRADAPSDLPHDGALRLRGARNQHRGPRPAGADLRRLPCIFNLTLWCRMPEGVQTKCGAS